MLLPFASRPGLAKVINDTNVTGLLQGVKLTLGWSGQLSIARGGTGQTTAITAFNALSPMTTLGDIIIATGVTGGAARLGGNTATNRYYLTSKGVAAAAQAPVWTPTGPMFDHFADAGNTTTGETDLYTDTTVANTLANNGDKLLFQYGGTFLAHATATREVKNYFAGSVILDSTALVTTANEIWQLRGTIIRVSATVVRCMVEFTASTSLGAKLFSEVIYTELTGLTLSNTNILKITGQAGTGGSTNDIIAKEGYVEIQPAA